MTQPPSVKFIDDYDMIFEALDDHVFSVEEALSVARDIIDALESGGELPDHASGHYEDVQEAVERADIDEGRRAALLLRIEQRRMSAAPVRRYDWH